MLYRAVAPPLGLGLLALTACHQLFSYTSDPSADATLADRGPLTDALSDEDAVLADGPADARADAPRADASVLLEEDNPDELAVVIPGRLRIVFMRSRRWQAGAVYDLAVAPEDNLVPDSAQAKHAVLVSPVGINADFTWQTLNEALNSAIVARQLAPDQVEVKTAWSWENTASYEVVATHRIDSDGLWQAEVTVTPDGPVRLLGFEMAYVNVDPALGWDAAVSPDARSFTLTRQGPGPTTTFRVTALQPVDGLEVHSDLAGNHYFIRETPIDLDAGSPLAVRWSIRFDPP